MKNRKNLITPSIRNTRNIPNIHLNRPIRPARQIRHGLLSEGKSAEQ